MSKEKNRAAIVFGNLVFIGGGLCEEDFFY